MKMIEEYIILLRNSFIHTWDPNIQKNRTQYRYKLLYQKKVLKNS